MDSAAHFAALRMAVLAEVPPLHAEEMRFGKWIAEAVEVPLDVTKAILRDLRNDGLIILAPGFDLDTGAPNGSGWIRTIAGEAEFTRHCIAVLEAENETAEGWGAAVSVRCEEIAALTRALKQLGG